MKYTSMSIIGDSFTEGCLYTESLKDIMHLSVINNYGIGGSCISGTSYDAFCNRYKELEPADLILIQGGTNDYGYSMELGQSESHGSSTFYGSLKILFEGLKVKFPEAPIVITTPSQRYWTGTAPGYTSDRVGINEKGYTLKDYVKAIANTASLYGVKTADLYDDCGITKNNVLEYTSDGLHPNKEGGKMIAECIALAFGINSTL